MNFQREIPSFNEDGEDARPDNDDEKPVVVQLREGDLTAEEVEQMEKEGVWRVKCKVYLLYNKTNCLQNKLACTHGTSSISFLHIKERGILL